MAAVCPACGHHPADTGIYADDEAEDGPDGLMLDNPWLGCAQCGEEWQAHGGWYVLADVPGFDSAGRDAFIQQVRLKGVTSCRRAVT